MKFSKKDFDTISKFSHKAQKNKFEFECLLKHPKPTQTSCERIIMYFQNSVNWICSRNEEITLDIFVYKFRFTITGKIYVDEYFKTNSLKNIPYDKLKVISKTKVSSSFSKDFGCCFNLNLEENIHNENDNLKYAIDTWEELDKYYRLKKRTSFDTHLLYRIDITIVTSPSNENTYEIELEYLPDLRFDTDLWVKTLNILLCINRNTNIISTLPQLFSVGNHYMNIVSNNVCSTLYKKSYYKLSPKVVSLTMDKYYELLYDCSEYRLAPKSDGLRMLGFITHNGELFIMEDTVNYFKSTGCYFNSEYSGTIFDGEFINITKHGEKIAHFLIFDCYFISKKDIRQESFDERIRLAESVLETFNESKTAYDGISFKIILKKFYRLSQENFHSKCQECWNEIEKQSYENDGLIFTPIDKVGGNDLYSNNNSKFIQSGCKFERLLKWKDSHFNSIDFKIKILDKDVDILNKINTDYVVSKCKKCVLYVLYSNTSKDSYVKEFTPEKKENEKYNTVIIPIVGNVLRCCPNDTWNGSVINDGNIVEMVYDTNAQKYHQWKPIRVRKDKLTPNYFLTAQNVWNTIHNPVTFTMIMKK